MPLFRCTLPLLFLLALAGSAAAQDTSYSDRQARGNRMPPVPKPDFQPLPARFSFTVDASALLHRLWQESVADGAEHVACIAGDVRQDSVRVTRVLLLEEPRSDSLGVSAGHSMEVCGPPDWMGTAHTHIAHRDGERPYPNFSGADRGIMQLWWARWEVDGLFCVLYTEAQAFCEVTGAGGTSRMSRGLY